MYETRWWRKGAVWVDISSPLGRQSAWQSVGPGELVATPRHSRPCIASAPVRSLRPADGRAPDLFRGEYAFLQVFRNRFEAMSAARCAPLRWPSSPFVRCLLAQLVGSRDSETPPPILRCLNYVRAHRHGVATRPFVRSGVRLGRGWCGERGETERRPRPSARPISDPNDSNTHQNASNHETEAILCGAMRGWKKN